MDSLEDIAAAFRRSPQVQRREDGGRTLKCPVCGADMAIERYCDIPIDACPEHGVWLDAGEGKLLVERIRGGQHAAMRTELAEARRQGKLSALLLGGWSLLLEDS